MRRLNAYKDISMACFSAFVLFFVFTCVGAIPCSAEERPWALNIFGGRMTTNHFEDFLGAGRHLNFKDSYLIATGLSREIWKFKDKAGIEIEGQLVKHFDIQNHWEFNALVAGRWKYFPWNRYLNTSVAFGLGPSYATDEPEIEIRKDGDTARFLIHWMLELALALPDYPRIAFITRIHHRSNAFGLMADEGGSNALVFGLKYKF